LKLSNFEYDLFSIFIFAFHQLVEYFNKLFQLSVNKIEFLGWTKMALKVSHRTVEFPSLLVFFRSFLGASQRRYASTVAVRSLSRTCFFTSDRK